MKIPITDKFLWTIYNLLEEVDRIHDFGARRTMPEAFSPDLFKMRREWQRRGSRKNFSKIVSYLKKKELIKIKNLEVKKAIILTRKGLRKALRTDFRMTKKKKRKDGKWIMLIFDIPEKKRSLRDLLRKHLYLLGYKLFQQSVWICPYDVLKKTERFLREYSLDPYVRIFLIEEVEIS